MPSAQKATSGSPIHGHLGKLGLSNRNPIHWVQHIPERTNHNTYQNRSFHSIQILYSLYTWAGNLNYIHDNSSCLLLKIQKMVVKQKKQAPKILLLSKTVYALPLSYMLRYAELKKFTLYSRPYALLHYAVASRYFVVFQSGGFCLGLDI